MVFSFPGIGSERMSDLNNGQTIKKKMSDSWRMENIICHCHFFLFLTYSFFFLTLSPSLISPLRTLIIFCLHSKLILFISFFLSFHLSDIYFHLFLPVLVLWPFMCSVISYSWPCVSGTLLKVTCTVYPCTEAYTENPLFTMYQKNTTLFNWLPCMYESYHPTLPPFSAFL